jgi:hypothetical protein
VGVTEFAKNGSIKAGTRRAVVAVLNRRGTMHLLRSVGRAAIRLAVMIGDDDGGTPVLKRLMCHHRETSPCQRCARLAMDRLALVGPGVERMAEAQALFRMRASRF